MLVGAGGPPPEVAGFAVVAGGVENAPATLLVSHINFVPS